MESDQPGKGAVGVFVRRQPGDVFFGPRIEGSVEPLDSLSVNRLPYAAESVCPDLLCHSFLTVIERVETDTGLMMVVLEPETVCRGGTYAHGFTVFSSAKKRGGNAWGMEAAL